MYPNGDSWVPSGIGEAEVRPVQTTRAFGAEVRRARKDAGLSQAELAARAGVGRPWLSELENGKRTVELGRVLLVLSVLGLAVSIVPEPELRPGEVDLSRLLGGG
jgi:HTH-type transcriptional regulator/antitoxin HipB